MNVPSFTTNTILRDPFLIKHLNEGHFRQNLHKGFQRFAFLIKRVYGPFTPEPESEEEEVEPEPLPKQKPKRYSKVWTSSSKRTSTQSVRDQKWQSMLLKYNKGAGDKRKKDRVRSRATNKPAPKGALKLPNIKKIKSEDRDLGAEKQRVRYVFRYSESLDMFKKQKYEERLREIGMDINLIDFAKMDFMTIDDPELLEVNLDWCRVGTFVEDRTAQTIYDDVSEADRYSVLFGVPRVPSRKSVISLISERSNLGLDTPGRGTNRTVNIQRLPPIGERP